MKSKLYIIILLLVPINMAGQLLISNGAYLTQSDGNMTLKGDWINNGTFNSSGGKVLFGGTAQSMSGSAALNSFTKLTIETGCVLTVTANTNVTVTDSLLNSAGNGGLILQSTVAGSASLINNSTGVGATVQRHMNANRWHIISPSISGQTVQSFATLGSNSIPTSGSNFGMMYYSESGGGWVYYTNPAAGNMGLGTGYLVRHTTNDSLNLAGTLNAAATNIAITKLANGWNSIGNPFPCSIGVNSAASTSENFLTYNAITNLNLDPVFAALYLWDEPAVRVSGVSYYKIICNAGFTSTTNRPILSQSYMQPGQGFIVKAKATGTVGFTTDMRVHENTVSFFKSAKVSWPGINLIVNSTSKSASTAVTLHENMTPGLDITYDVGHLGGDPSFKLYSRLVEDNGINFAIQCLPIDGFDNMSVPIGFDCKNGGTVTFTSDVEPFPAGVKVTLADSLLGVFTNFRESLTTYTTTVNPNTSGTGRFFLNFSNTPTLVNTITDEHAITIYSIGKEIIVKGKINLNTKANLYDLTGHLVKAYLLAPSDTNILPADDMPAGIYLLTIFDGGLNVKGKVFLE